MSYLPWAGSDFLTWLIGRCYIRKLSFPSLALTCLSLPGCDSALEHSRERRSFSILAAPFSWAESIIGEPICLTPISGQENSVWGKAESAPRELGNICSIDATPVYKSGQETPTWQTLCLVGPQWIMFSKKSPWFGSRVPMSIPGALRGIKGVQEVSAAHTKRARHDNITWKWHHCLVTSHGNTVAIGANSMVKNYSVHPDGWSVVVWCYHTMMSLGDVITLEMITDTACVGLVMADTVI